MAYSNNGNRNSAQIDINTNSMILFYGTMALRVDLYNKNVNLGLIRAVQTAEGKNTFPKENMLRVLLTPERVTALNIMIQNGLIPALEEKRSFEGAIITNNKMTNLVSVGCDLEGNAHLDIYTDMDERRIPKKAARYIFPKTATLSRFNPPNGEYEQGDSIQAQLYLFARCLEDFIFNSSMSAAHNQRMIENNYNRKILNLLQEIAIKNGIPVQRNATDGGQPGYRYGGSGNSGGAYSQVPTPPAQTESNVTSLDNMDGPDLPF